MNQNDTAILETIATQALKRISDSLHPTTQKQETESNKKILDKKLTYLTSVKNLFTSQSYTEILMLALGNLKRIRIAMPAIARRKNVETILKMGFEIIPVDVSNQCWTMNKIMLPDKINSKTAAVFVENLFGAPAQTAEIYQIANKLKIPVIDDITSAIGAVGPDGAHAGTQANTTICDLSDTNYTKPAQAAAFMHATNTLLKPTPLNEFTAAVLIEIIDIIPHATLKKNDIAQTYFELLDKFETQKLQKNAVHSYDKIVINTKNSEKILQKLQSFGIECKKPDLVFVPELSGHNPDAFPIAKKLHDSTIELPSHLTLADDAIRFIVNQIYSTSTGQE